jgi:hypothetical protein
METIMLDRALIDKTTNQNALNDTSGFKRRALIGATAVWRINFVKERDSHGASRSQHSTIYDPLAAVSAFLGF